MTTINRENPSAAPLTIEEKIMRLSTQDKAYLNGYLDCALRGKAGAADLARPVPLKGQTARDG